MAYLSTVLRQLDEDLYAHNAPRPPIQGPDMPQCQMTPRRVWRGDTVCTHGAEGGHQPATLMQTGR
jgi:hypothetical protein